MRQLKQRAINYYEESQYNKTRQQERVEDNLLEKVRNCIWNNIKKEVKGHLTLEEFDWADIELYNSPDEKLLVYITFPEALSIITQLADYGFPFGLRIDMPDKEEKFIIHYKQNYDHKFKYFGNFVEALGMAFLGYNNEEKLP